MLSFLTTGLLANFLDKYFALTGVEIVLQGSAILIFISGCMGFFTGYKKIINDFGIENSNFNNIKLDFRPTEDEPEWIATT